MPNVDILIDMIAEKLDEKEGDAWYSTLDMTYAYGQIFLQELTKRHCNFQTVGGKSTGTYRFTTGFLWPYSNANIISKVDGHHFVKCK